MKGSPVPACPSMICFFNKGCIKRTNVLNVCVWCFMFVSYLCLDWFCWFDLWLILLIWLLYVRRVLKYVFFFLFFSCQTDCRNVTCMAGRMLKSISYLTCALHRLCLCALFLRFQFTVCDCYIMIKYLRCCDEWWLPPCCFYGNP